MDPGASSFERDLLESWSAEQPSPGARARALALGGLAASGAALVGVGAGAPKAASLAGMAFVKWALLGVLVVGAATASIVRATSSPTPPPAAAAAAPPLSPAFEPVTSPTVTATQERAAGAEGAVAASDLPTVAVSRAGTATPTAAVAAPADSLTDEIAAFDGVRAAEASGDADRTLALAAAYERRYPSGTFFQEAEVLRIESLAKKGDREGAAKVGQRFLVAHPQSPHAGRIRAIVDASTR